MAAIPQSPLNDNHLTEIKGALNYIQSAEQQLELAERAGIDVTAHRVKLAESKDKLLRIKNVYFPNS